ncbi:MAG: HAD-IB family hydrolase [Actinomycetota bacterium]|jgi:phosphatidylglycerophosphatase C
MAHDSSPVVAAFDLDGTLTEGGSVVSWLRHVGGTPRVLRSVLARLLPLAVGAVASGTRADTAKESLFRAVLAGRPVDIVAAQSLDYAHDHVERYPRPHVIARLRWHLEQGHRVVIVSASPEIYVQRVAEILGAHHAIGTRLAVNEKGQLGGGYDGANCRGAEKFRRLHAWLKENDSVDGKVELYAYGNSRGDRRLLAAANHAYDCGKLGRFGALRKFERWR